MNPIISQNYTIRVYSGANDCFPDVDWNADGTFGGMDEMIIDWDDSIGALPNR